MYFFLFHSPFVFIPAAVLIRVLMLVEVSVVNSNLCVGVCVTVCVCVGVCRQSHCRLID